jgi:hypothetical protein
MDRWLKCQEGDLTALRVDPAIGTEEQDFVAWEMVNQNYVETFGVSRKHVRYLQLQKELLLVRMEYLISEDKFLLNRIDDIEREMSTVFVSDQPNANITTTFIHLSKFMGYRITAETISVLEFFTMVEEYGKNN